MCFTLLKFVFIANLCLWLLLRFLPHPTSAQPIVYNSESSISNLQSPVSSCSPITSPGTYILTADLKAGWDCINIRASNVTLDCDGKRIEGENYLGKGILVERYGENGNIRPQHVEIKNCRIAQFQYGIVVENGSDIYIHDNDLSGNWDDTRGSYHGAWLGIVDGGGLRMNESEASVIEGNVAHAGANGIDLRDSHHIVIRNNVTASNSAYGILLTNTSDSVIEGNTVNDNVRWCTFPGEQGEVVVPGCDSAGIMLQDGSSRNIVRENSLQGQNGDGIFMRNHTGRCGDDNVILNNRIVGAVWNGLEAGFCDGVKIIGNEFAQSKFGVWISYMDRIVLQSNRFNGIEQSAVVIKNSHHALIKNNWFNESGEGLLLVTDQRDAQSGWTLRHPFAYYRSYANVVSDNSFFHITTNAIRLQDSNANQIGTNSFLNVPTPLMIQGECAC